VVVLGGGVFAHPLALLPLSYAQVKTFNNLNFFC